MYIGTISYKHCKPDKVYLSSDSTFYVESGIEDKRYQAEATEKRVFMANYMIKELRKRGYSERAKELTRRVENIC